MISYEPFWTTLKNKNISTYRLLKDEIITPTTLQRLRRNESVNVHTIDVLCQALDCTITDIVVILPNEKLSISEIDIINALNDTDNTKQQISKKFQEEY